MGFLTDFLKFITEVSKTKDYTSVATMAAIGGSVFLYLLLLHVIKVYSKSQLDKCFMTKDQQILHGIYSFFYVFLTFNIMCFTWAWFVSDFFDYNSLPLVLDFLFTASLFYFLLVVMVIFVSIIVKLIQKKLFHIKPTKLANSIYKSITNASLVGFYLCYMVGLFYYFDTRDKTDSYGALFGDIGMFLLASFLIFMFFGTFIINFFELGDPSFSSILLNEKKHGPLYVLHALDAKNIVLGDNRSEAKSTKLFLYNLEKREIDEFEKKIIKADDPPIVYEDTNLPPRSKRRQ